MIPARADSADKFASGKTEYVPLDGFSQIGRPSEDPLAQLVRELPGEIRACLQPFNGVLRASPAEVHHARSVARKFERPNFCTDDFLFPQDFESANLVSCICPKYADVIHNLLTRFVSLCRVTKINQGDDLRRAFGNAVKARRNRIGISQDELAWRATVHRTYITNVERGICNPSLGSISKIARALGTSTATLLADVEMSAGPSESKSESSSVDILLVEDSENDVELTVQALKGAGLANIVDVARDGAEALDYFFSHDTHPGRKIKGRPGLILLDLNLPKVSGIEVLQRLKAEPSTASVPVVVLTASKHDGDVKECLRLGANAYIVKPVNFRSLSEVAPQLNLCWMLLRSPARAAA